jgi:ABC-2 type transport system permease protein
MFYLQLRNELWKLFGKKRTYIGFGAFLLAQTLMLLLFRFGHVQDGFKRMLSGNGYDASDYISALSVSVVMLAPQISLLMPLYATLVGGDLVAKEAEDGTLRMILSRPISRVRLLLVKWGAGVIFAVAAGAGARRWLRWALRACSFRGRGCLCLSPGRGVQRPDGGRRPGALHAFPAHCSWPMNASAILSVAFMFSCFNMKPASATILALSFLLVQPGHGEHPDLWPATRTGSSRTISNAGC